MLQTEAYARFIINPSGELPPERHDLFVEARLSRQSVLSGDRSPQIVFYIHEAALQSLVGDNQVMHDQMLRLAFMCDWARPTPRVIPLGSRGHAALHHPFEVMTFTKHIEPIAYTEDATATTFMEEDQAVEVHQSTAAKLADPALEGPQSKPCSCTTPTGTTSDFSSTGSKSPSPCPHGHRSPVLLFTAPASRWCRRSSAARSWSGCRPACGP